MTWVTVSCYTLVAQWWKNTSVVTFDPGCDDYEGTMEPQSFATPLEGDWEEKPLSSNAFTRAGYTFAGWTYLYKYTWADDDGVEQEGEELWEFGE